MEELKNDKITVIISAHGAELQSIKSAEGREYLWQGDEKYWPRRSPLLFPIVCGLWNGQYRVDGKTYELPRHGFARDMDFDVIEKTESSVTYELTSNEETMKVYPYEFGLNVSYFLNDDMINVVWTVRNMGKEEMHFQIGGHPAFNLPDVGEGDKVEGTLLFDNEQPLTRIIGNTGGCIKPEIRREDRPPYMGVRRGVVCRRRRDTRQVAGGNGGNRRQGRTTADRPLVRLPLPWHLDSLRQARTIPMHRTVVWRTRLGWLRRRIQRQVSDEPSPAWSHFHGLL